MDAALVVLAAQCGAAHQPVGAGELRTRRLGLEHLHRLGGHPCALGGAADAGQHSHLEDEVVAQLEDVTALAPDVDRLVERVRPAVAHVGQVRLAREALEQLGALV